MGGGTDYLWYGIIFFRILPFVPTSKILEIAPGYGRCTQYLLGLCKRLQIVDLNQNCINFCKKRFSDHSHIQYYVNNGTSLEMIADNSIDFVFSWDSLVHCGADVLDSYLDGCSRILKPNGWGFIHRSNIGSYRNLLNGGHMECENIHSRGITMSAKLFQDFCIKNNLKCIRQEMVNWGRVVLNDCFSIFTKQSITGSSDMKTIENNEFHMELNRVKNISDFYKF